MLREIKSARAKKREKAPRQEKLTKYFRVEKPSEVTAEGREGDSEQAGAKGIQTYFQEMFGKKPDPVQTRVEPRSEDVQYRRNVNLTELLDSVPLVEGASLKSKEIHQSPIKERGVNIGKRYQMETQMPVKGSKRVKAAPKELLKTKKKVAYREKDGEDKKKKQKEAIKVTSLDKKKVERKQQKGQMKKIVKKPKTNNLKKIKNKKTRNTNKSPNKPKKPAILVQPVEDPVIKSRVNTQNRVGPNKKSAIGENQQNQAKPSKNKTHHKEAQLEEAPTPKKRSPRCEQSTPLKNDREVLKKVFNVLEDFFVKTKKDFISRRALEEALARQGWNHSKETLDAKLETLSDINKIFITSESDLIYKL